MAIGLSTLNLVHKWLNALNGSSFSVTSVYVQLHTGDPGAAGMSNVSAETDRKLVVWDAADSGAMAMNGTLIWAAWDVGTEIITHVSLHDDPTAGDFLWSGELSVGKTVSNDDALNLTSLVASVTPLSA